MRRLRPAMSPVASLPVGRGVRLRLAPGGLLTLAEFEALWSVRARVHPLQPQIDPAVDFAAFAKKLRASTEVAQLLAGGRVAGFWQYRVLRVEVAGRGVPVLLADFAYIEPEHRGHPAPMLWLVWSLLRELRRHRALALYAAGTAYPSSWLLAARRGMTPLADGQAPPGSPEAAILAALRAEVTGADDGSPRPVVALNTVPELPPPRWLKRHAADPVFRAYEALNPRWRDGHAVYGVTRLDARACATVLSSASRRAVRRWTAG